MTIKEKRKDVRRSVNTPVDFTVQGRFYQGLIKNKSKGGIFIDAGGPFSVGQVISVEYLVPSFGKIKKTGTIEWVGPKGIGVKFRAGRYSD